VKNKRENKRDLKSNRFWDTKYAFLLVVNKLNLFDLLEEQFKNSLLFI